MQKLRFQDYLHLIVSEERTGASFTKFLGLISTNFGNLINDKSNRSEKRLNQMNLNMQKKICIK